MNDVAPKPVLGAIAVRNAVNSYAATTAETKHPDVEQRPSTAGKRAVFFDNTALGFYAFANLAKDKAPRSSLALRGIAHSAAAIGIGYYGIPATRELINRSRT